MGRKPKIHSVSKQASGAPTSRLCIGDCNVSIPPGLSYKCSDSSISITVPKRGQLCIAGSINSKGRQGPREGVSVQLLNPKLLDHEDSRLLKDVLKLYNTELPAMSFAANTGKESPFLDMCVNSGKYCTLVLRKSTSITDEVVAAISYQILPTDTQYVEIVLAAVGKDYQRKGLGSLLVSELRRRLQDVGVLTVFCWGDKESEEFWVKQGFIEVANVDRLGKPRKLPIKPEIRRAMSIPGNATLLVFVMCKKVPIGVYQSASKAAETPPKLAHQPALFELTNEALPASCSQRSPALPITTPVIGELRAPPQTPVMLAPHIQSEKSFAIVPFNMDSAFSSVMNYKESQFNTPNKGNAFVDIPIEPVSPLTFAAPTEYGTPTGDAYDLGESANLFHEHYPGANNEARSTSNKKSNRVRQYKRGRKRKNPSILQVEISKKLKNSPQTRNVYDSELRESQRCGSNVRADPGPHVSMDLLTTAEHSDNAMEMAERNIKGKTCCLDVGQKSMPIIMFMNMADDNRKLHLTKFVERLGGRVTNDGGQCTHVVTGEARRTLNFCNALNTGAWVVSPAWLKVSVKEKRFVDEEPFILKDGAFESKYKTTLGEVIKRRKRMPHGLLQGVCVYPTKHVQPPVETISAIVLSAGGKVVTSFEEAKLCRETVVIACEDDISEALMAAKEGLATFSSEWLMSCIMKQELDRTSSQFAESL